MELLLSITNGEDYPFPNVKYGQNLMENYTEEIGNIILAHQSIKIEEQGFTKERRRV